MKSSLTVPKMASTVQDQCKIYWVCSSSRPKMMTKPPLIPKAPKLNDKTSNIDSKTAHDTKIMTRPSLTKKTTTQ